VVYISSEKTMVIIASTVDDAILVVQLVRRFISLLAI